MEKENINFVAIDFETIELYKAQNNARNKY